MWGCNHVLDGCWDIIYQPPKYLWYSGPWVCQAKPYSMIFERLFLDIHNCEGQHIVVNNTGLCSTPCPFVWAIEIVKTLKNVNPTIYESSTECTDLLSDCHSVSVKIVSLWVEACLSMYSLWAFDAVFASLVWKWPINTLFWQASQRVLVKAARRVWLEAFWSLTSRCHLD